MIRRKLLSSLAAAGVLAIAIGPTVGPAQAKPRTFVVTLLGGAQLTLTLDVPEGTPVDQITIPDLKLPIVAISEVTPAGPVAEPTAVPTGTAPPATIDADKPTTARPDANQHSQKTKRRAPSKAKTLGDVGDLVGVVEDEATKRRVVGGLGRNVDGTPTLDNPGFALAIPGAAPIGVPNFFIDRFRIPPFLLPIYQAAGIQYGVRWEVLAAINEIETDYGRNLRVSSAGAVGWMQFIPSSWKRWGVDANRDKVKDPYNPVDAIFSAARYLRAAGAETDLAKAIFAYNHADWYVDSVLLRARVLGGLPSNFVGSLTGLTQGHFPVAAKATYADDLSEARLSQRRRMRNPAWLVNSSVERRAIHVYSRENAPVIAVNDGKIVSVGRNARLGRFVKLQDVYGNTYTYAHLKAAAKLYPAARQKTVTRAQIAREMALPKTDGAPSAPATAGGSPADAPSAATEALKTPLKTIGQAAKPVVKKAVTETARTVKSAKERLFANPFRPRATRAGGAQQVLAGKAPKGSFEVFRAGVSRVFGIRTKSKDITLKPLKPGARVIAGTILGRLGVTRRGIAPHLLFEIRPAGRGAPRIDPKPILDGWKLLESTAIYRAAGRNPFSGPDAAPTIGEILLMGKQDLQRQVLADPRIEIYGCGRRDVDLGQIDRRVLATLEFLSLSGFKPTVTSLKCGHSYYTKSGHVSHHSSGNAVDIAAINGVPVLGHQGPGSITDIAVQRLLTLQGLMKPAQIITLMTYKDAENTYAMRDHADHIHVGFQPLYGTNTKAAKQVNAILKPDQWIKLVDRLGKIDNPTVRLNPSKYAIEAVERASKAHAGE